MNETKVCAEGLMRKPQGKQLLTILSTRGRNNIKMYLKDTGWEGMNWIHLAQDRNKWQALATKVMNR
jgi:hypothetical protein